MLLPALIACQALAGNPPPEGMVLIPAGEFTMGSATGNPDEAPAHTVRLPAFYMDRLEVTNAGFALFVRRTGAYERIEGPWFRYCAEGCADLVAHFEELYGASLEEARRAREEGQDLEWRRRAARWRAAEAALQEMEGGASLSELVRRQGRLPVRGVSWRDAAAYARWAGKRLPTEAEWERAARGPGLQTYPWGSGWDPRRCRAGLEPEAGPAPVGSFLRGASPEGCLDMAGNVWEWVADWYAEDYYVECQGAADPRGPEGLSGGRLPSRAPAGHGLRSPLQGRESDTRKVIRGGGWSGTPVMAAYNTRCSRRLWSNPSSWHPDLGFRCAKDAE